MSDLIRKIVAIIIVIVLLLISFFNLQAQKYMKPETNREDAGSNPTMHQVQL